MHYKIKIWFDPWAASARTGARSTIWSILYSDFEYLTGEVTNAFLKRFQPEGLWKKTLGAALFSLCWLPIWNSWKMPLALRKTMCGHRPFVYKLKKNTHLNENLFYYFQQPWYDQISVFSIRTTSVWESGDKLQHRYMRLMWGFTVVWLSWHCHLLSTATVGAVTWLKNVSYLDCMSHNSTQSYIHSTLHAELHVSHQSQTLPA